MKNILIVGATSAIAQATARVWSSQGSRFFLVSRQRDRLTEVANDLRARGAKSVDTFLLDIQDTDSHGSMVLAAYAGLGSIDVALIAHGTLPDQAACEDNAQVALTQFNINASSTIAILTHVAKLFSAQAHGTIAVITSVAADRGRSSNYLYGAAKAAVTTFCDGLRVTMARRGVHVLVIKPGFVNTPMTQALKLPASLTAEPERVADDIVVAIDKNKNTLYTPWYWGLIMLIVRSIPTPIFKRLKL